jgi:hypothetical protein
MFGRIREELSERASRFDARLLDADAAAEELDHVAAIENIAATQGRSGGADRGDWDLATRR